MGGEPGCVDPSRRAGTGAAEVAPRRRRSLLLFEDRLHLPLPDRSRERGVVLLVLVGVGDREAGDRLVEHVACLDDLTPEWLSALPVIRENGREDRWEVAPKEAAYL